MAQQLTFEASELGFQPGQWPQSFEQDGRTFSFVFRAEDDEGDVTLVEYKAADGTEAIVYND